MRRRRLAVAGATALAISGCSSAGPALRTLGPASPVTVCKQTLDAGPMGLLQYALPGIKSAFPMPAHGTLQPPLLIQVASGCSHGVLVAISPPTFFAITSVVKAHDGGIVAIRIEPTIPQTPGVYEGTLVVATRAGAQLARLPLRQQVFAGTS